MYSNYGSYNQNVGCATVSTQPAMIWNGHQWTQPSYGVNNVGPSSYSTYNSSYQPEQPSQQHHQQHQQQQQPQQQSIPDNPVQTFTRYYNEWTARAQEEESRAQGWPMGSTQRAESERLAGWSKYYADLSSRAAHHFYQNPNATYVPFDLPPSPSLSNGTQQEENQTPQLQQQQQQQQPQQYQQGTTSSSSSQSKGKSHPSKSRSSSSSSSLKKHKVKSKSKSDAKDSSKSGDQPPDGLKRYVHRCLRKCTTKEQEQAVHKKIELVIACALQDETLHTTDWERMPPIDPFEEQKSPAKKSKVSESSPTSASVTSSVTAPNPVSAAPVSVPAPASASATPSVSVSTAASLSSSVSVTASAAPVPASAPTPASGPALVPVQASPSVNRGQTLVDNDSYYGDQAVDGGQNLVRNDSYYGDPGRIGSMGNKKVSTGSQSRAFHSVPSSFANPIVKPNDFSDQQLLENDSYYGHSSGTISSKNNRNGMNKRVSEPPAHQSFSNRNSQPHFRSQQQKLQETDSYYGNPNRSESRNGKPNHKRKSDKIEKDDYYSGSLNNHCTSKSFVSSSTSSTNPQISEPHNSSRTQQLLENDSYYGTPSNAPSVCSTVPKMSKQSKKNTNKKNGRKLSPINASHRSVLPSCNTNSTMPHKVSFESESDDTDSSINRSPISKSDGLDRSSKALAKRANRFKGRGTSAKQSKRAANENGYDKYMGKGTIGGSQKPLNDLDYENMTVKGTCQTLEKKYLRLTAPPRPELVRPLRVLEKHVRNLKKEWKAPLSTRRDYDWFCSQFKAVRQDCTVQRIRNAFTVDVYETHARIALEENDLNEYNQCQTQLKELYASIDDPNALQNLHEFIAYRLIYYVFLTLNKKYDGGSSDLFKIMLSLTTEQRRDPAISHALKVRMAVTDVDYHQFFLLRKECPNLGHYLMDSMVANMRFWALQRIGKAYRPSVEVDFVLKELGFAIDDESESSEGKRWMSSCGCVLSEDGKIWSTKDSTVRESDLTKSKSSLI